MKKNLFLKILATTLAFMLVISGGLTALADSRVEDSNGNVLDHQKDLTWNSDVAYAQSDASAGETTSLTLNADIINNDSSFALLVYVEDDGKATVKTGDLTENNDTAYSALHVNTWGEIEKEDADVTVGKIDSESDGIRIDSNGGDIDVTTEDLEAKGTGVFVSNMVDLEPVAGTGKNPYGMTYEDHETEKTGYMIYSDSNGDLYADFFDGTGMVYQFKEIDCSGETDVQINGDVTVTDGNDEFIQGVVSQNMSENNTSEITVAGDVEVSADQAKTAIGVEVESYAGEASADVTGDITVTAASTEPVASAAGAVITAYEEGTSELTVTGDISAEGMRAFGLNMTSGDDYYEADGGTVLADVTGDITVTGTSMAEGIHVSVAGEGSATVTLEGDITAKAEKAYGIWTNNVGGTIDISQQGDITSEYVGIELRDKPGMEEDPSLIGTMATVIADEYDYVTQMSDGPGSEPVDVAVYHHENEDGSWYDYFEDGTIIDAWKAVDHNPGTTVVTITGDVTAEETGAVIDLTNDKSKIDLIVDGTLSGETQSVLVSENTIADNLILTVWEIKANDDGKLVERVVEYNDDDEAVTEVDRDIEKNIQYIIKITPAQQDIITTQGTTNYEGYNVANEGDTVTLKVEVPQGYQIKSAFSDSDQTIEMAQDDDGNYYLIVPKGGAVMISVEFEKIPDPDPEPEPRPEPQPQPAPAAETVEETKTTITFVQTTKVAIMKPADETSETETLKEEIQTSDIQSILPDDIKEQLPEGVTTVAETITMTLENYDPEMGTVTLKIAPRNKTYTKGEKATVVIALPDGNGGYTYFYIEGEGQEDGTLSLNIPTDTAKALAGKTFVTMILE